MLLEIITPEKVVFEAEITSVALPGYGGEFQVLNNHADIISALNSGKVKIQASNLTEDQIQSLSKSSSNNYEYVIKGGVFEFRKNKAIILAD